VSSRHTRSFFGVMLAVVFALSAVVVAPASAKLTKHQKAHMRHKLMRQIKHNPKLIRNKRFIKKASLVDFTLPVTVKLRQSDAASGNLTGVNNPNHATIDLGASLGQRDIYLGGTLPAEIQFHDSFDGGALGNVDLKLLPGGNLTSTAIPLLWNSQVSQGGGSWSNPTAPGCSDFTGSGNLTNVIGELAASPVSGIFAAAGNAPPVNRQSGAPVFAPDLTGLPASYGNNAKTFLTQFQNFENKLAAYQAAPDPPSGPNFLAAVNAASPANLNWGLIDATAPEKPGVDSIDNIKLSDVPGDDNNVGVSPNPFPSAAPGTDPTQNPGPAPTYKDVVLRTNALHLAVAPVGSVNQSNPADGAGAQGSDKVTIGPSGGQANLFGNIPGKDYGIDVTVSLQTKINSIIREVDADTPALVESLDSPFVQNIPWPGASFQCRQAWTGAVQNYLAGIHLTGSLKISPAITSAGKLRIAKATLQQQSIGGTVQKTRVALAACLSPYSTYANETGILRIPSTGDMAGTQFPFGDALLPINSTTAAANAAPSAVACNSGPDALVGSAGVQVLTNGHAPYGSTTADGSQVSVAGDLAVSKIEADVLIGQNQ
jgi:hypothetical protein